MIILYFLLAALVYSDVPSATPPLFKKELCVEDSGLACLSPKACESEKMTVYELPESRKLCDVQIIIRQFDKQEALIEIWAEGTSIDVKYEGDITMIGFEVNAGKVVPKQMTNNNFKLLESTVDGNKFYVKFISDNFPAPSDDEKQDIIKFKDTYKIERDELNSFLKKHLDRWCPVSTLVPGLKAPEDFPDTKISELSKERLFDNQITCDQPYELYYEEGSDVKKAKHIGCKKGKRENLFQVSREDGTIYTVPANTNLKIGCLQKYCLTCSDLPCAGTDCKELQPFVTDDGCPVHFCPRFLIQTLDGIVHSNITCAKTEDDSFAWSANNKKLSSMKCAKQAPCHTVSPLKCEDAACSMVTSIMESPIHCKNNKQMYLEPIGGSKTPIEEITCNSETGRYMKSNVSEIPKGAKVICEDTKGSALGDQTTTGGMTYVGAGVAGLVVLIIVIVVAVVCIRKSRKNKRVAPVGTTTRQEAVISGATSKSSEAAKKTSEAPVVPEAPVTPGAPGDPAVPGAAAELPLAPTQPTMITMVPYEENTMERTQDMRKTDPHLFKGFGETTVVRPGEEITNIGAETTNIGAETKITKSEKKKEKKKEKKQKKSKKKKESEKEPDEKSEENSKTEKKKKKESETEATFGFSGPEETQKSQNVTGPAPMEKIAVIPNKIEPGSNKKPDADNQYESLGAVEAQAKKHENAADQADKLLKTQASISTKEKEKK